MYYSTIQVQRGAQPAVLGVANFYDPFSARHAGCFDCCVVYMSTEFKRSAAVTLAASNGTRAVRGREWLLKLAGSNVPWFPYRPRAKAAHDSI